MTNYRIANAVEITASVITVSASAALPVWGVLKATAATSGTLYFTGGGSVKLEYLPQGYPIPCYFGSINVDSGSVYLLA